MVEIDKIVGVFIVQTDPGICANKHIVLFVDINIANQIIRQAIGLVDIMLVNFNIFPVVTVQSIVCANPHKSVGILNNG